MDYKYVEIQELLEKRAEIADKLNTIPYDGHIEIKAQGDKKYIYLRKWVLGHNTSTYVDIFSDDSLATISKLLKDAKEYKKQIRKINNELNKLGYIEQKS